MIYLTITSFDFVITMFVFENYIWLKSSKKRKKRRKTKAGNR